MQINLSLCRTSDLYFLLSLQSLLWDSLENKNVLSRHVQDFLKDIQIMVTEKMLQKLYGVYLPEII